MTLAVLQPKVKTNPNFHHMNKAFQISPSFINLVVKNKEGGAGGSGAENTFLPLKRGAYYRRRGLNRGFTVISLRKKTSAFVG